jgi:hypothetical protein
MFRNVWQAQQPKDNSNYALVSWAMHTVILGEHMSMYSGMYKQQGTSGNPNAELLLSEAGPHIIQVNYLVKRRSTKRLHVRWVARIRLWQLTSLNHVESKIPLDFSTAITISSLSARRARLAYLKALQSAKSEASTTKDLTHINEYHIQL